MARGDGKGRFFKYMLDEELISEDEFKDFLWYIREVRDPLEKETE